MWLPWSQEEAFDLFGDVEQLDSLTPSWFRLVPVRSRDRLSRLAAGAKIDYKLRWRGLPLRWQSVIVTWRRPDEIVYRQGRGPFGAFRHEHYFQPEGSGTRVTDKIFFRSPGGDFGRRLLIEPDLRRILDYRRAAVGGW